jgi:hypothetical protein
MRRAAGLFLLITGCSTAPSSKIQKPEIVAEKTVLPKTFDQVDPTKKILASDDLVDIASIGRKTAELRQGPGIEYPLVDQPLKMGDPVVLYQKIGNWQKIISPYKDIIGWVHVKTLSSSQKGEKLIELDTAKLPRIFAVRDISVAWDQQDRKLQVDIKKGSSFSALKQTDHLVLVFLPQTNSAIWLRQRDAQ